MPEDTNTTKLTLYRIRDGRAYATEVNAYHKERTPGREGYDDITRMSHFTYQTDRFNATPEDPGFATYRNQVKGDPGVIYHNGDAFFAEGQLRRDPWPNRGTDVEFYLEGTRQETWKEARNLYAEYMSQVAARTKEDYQELTNIQERHGMALNTPPVTEAELEEIRSQISIDNNIQVSRVAVDLALAHAPSQNITNLMDLSEIKGGFMPINEINLAPPIGVFQDVLGDMRPFDMIVLEKENAIQTLITLTEETYQAKVDPERMYRELQKMSFAQRDAIVELASKITDGEPCGQYETLGMYKIPAIQVSNKAKDLLEYLGEAARRTAQVQPNDKTGSEPEKIDFGRYRVMKAVLENRVENKGLFDAIQTAQAVYEERKEHFQSARRERESNLQEPAETNKTKATALLSSMGYREPESKGKSTDKDDELSRMMDRAARKSQETVARHNPEKMTEGPGSGTESRR